MTAQPARPALLVIFGAGASYDSLPVPPRVAVRVRAATDENKWRPPLASQLFNLDNRDYAAIAAQFPEAIPRISEANQVAARGGAIEEKLEEWQLEAETNTRRFRQLTGIRFYLQELLWHASVEWIGDASRHTNYLLLADQLEDWRQRANAEIAYVTFNYDLMLEDALPHLRLPHFRDSYRDLPNADDYIEDQDTRVFKVHGSVNWVHELLNSKVPDGFGHAKVRSEIALRMSKMEIGKPIRVLGDPMKPVYEGKLTSPALAIPVVTKRAFECPDEHISALVQSVGRVQWILVVGWRGTEEHFNAILDHHLPHPVDPIRLHVVARNSQSAPGLSKRLAQRWSAKSRRRFRASASGGGFAEFLGRSDLRRILFGH